MSAGAALAGGGGVQGKIRERRGREGRKGMGGPPSWALTVATACQCCRNRRVMAQQLNVGFPPSLPRRVIHWWHQGQHPTSAAPLLHTLPTVHSCTLYPPYTPAHSTHRTLLHTLPTVHSCTLYPPYTPAHSTHRTRGQVWATKQQRPLDTVHSCLLYCCSWLQPTQPDMKHKTSLRWHVNVTRHQTRSDCFRRFSATTKGDSK